MMAAWTLLLLLAHPYQDDAIERFNKAYKSPDPQERAAAVRELGRAKDRKVLKVLAGLLRRDETVVRVEAAQAIGGFQELAKEATSYLISGLSANSDPAVQAAILNALGALKEDGAAPLVNKWISVKETDVAKAAIDTTGKIRNKSSVEPLIDLLGRLEKEGSLSRSAGNKAGGPNVPGSARTDSNRDARQRSKVLTSACREALQQITAEKYTKAEDWQVWWKRNGARFQVQK